MLKRLALVLKDGTVIILPDVQNFMVRDQTVSLFRKSKLSVQIYHDVDTVTCLKTYNSEVS